MKKLSIAVIGLGGVGGYIAANLSKGSHNVVGFARGEHLQKIKQDGIKIVEDTESWSSEFDVRGLHEADGYFDIVLFCVKSYDLKESYDAIKGQTDSKTILLSVANGVEHGDELRVWSDSKVLDGCVYILSHIQEAGVIRKKGKVFALVFGRDNDSVGVLKDVCEEVSLRFKTPDDIKTAVWKKYIFISAYATLTSYYDNTIGFVYEHHYDETKALLKEIADVAKAKGLDIYDEVNKSLEIASSLPYDASTSMYLDFKNKKRDELETLSGFIVREAKEHGVEVPLMSMMYKELLKKHI